jgi:hypothetical protein
MQVRPITQYSRHRSPHQMWRVRTTDGRTVTVTGDHNFVRLGRDLRLEVIPTASLAPGDLLPLPDRTPGPAEPVTHFDVAGLVKGRRLFVPAPRTPADIRRGRVDGRTSLDHASVALLERPDARVVTAKGPVGLDVRTPLDHHWLRFLGLFIAEGYVADGYATITPGPENMLLAAGLMSGCGVGFRQRSSIET